MTKLLARTSALRHELPYLHTTARHSHAFEVDFVASARHFKQTSQAAKPLDAHKRWSGPVALIDYPVFHDDVEVLLRLANDVDVGKRVAIDQQ